MYIVIKSPADSPGNGKYVWYYRPMAHIYFDAGFSSWKFLAFLRVAWAFTFFHIGSWVMKMAFKQVIKRHKKGV